MEVEVCLISEGKLEAGMSISYRAIAVFEWGRIEPTTWPQHECCFQGVRSLSQHWKCSYQASEELVEGLEGRVDPPPVMEGRDEP